MKMPSSLRKTAGNVALTNCGHRERWDKVRAGPHEKRSSRTVLQKHKDLLQDQKPREGGLGGVFFFPLLNQEREYSLRGLGGQSEAERKCLCCEQVREDRGKPGEETGPGTNSLSILQHL